MRLNANSVRNFGHELETPADASGNKTPVADYGIVAVAICSRLRTSSRHQFADIEPTNGQPSGARSS
jgi:hypothetical protein